MRVAYPMWAYDALGLCLRELFLPAAVTVAASPQTDGTLAVVYVVSNRWGGRTDVGVFDLEAAHLVDFADWLAEGPDPADLHRLGWGEDTADGRWV